MLELSVGGISCGSCVVKITRAIRKLDDAAQVVVDRAAGRVEVDTTESAEAVCDALAALGYPAVPRR